MTRSPIVTEASVEKLVLATPGKITLKSLREGLGGGSMTDIHATLKKVLSKLEMVPDDLRTKLEPVMSAGAEVVRGAVKEAVEAMRERLEILESCGDELEGALMDSLADERRLMAENESLRNELRGRESDIKIMAESVASLKAAMEEIKAALVPRTILEEDYLEVKTETAEVRDLASKFEGRLEEVERRMAMSAADKPSRNSPAKKAKS